jgi:hypothetical protein
MKRGWLLAAPAAALCSSAAAPGASGAHLKPSNIVGLKLWRRQWGSTIGDMFHRQVAPWFQQHEFDEADEVTLIPVMKRGDRFPRMFKVPMKVGVFGVELLLDTGSADT